MERLIFVYLTYYLAYYLSVFEKILYLSSGILFLFARITPHKNLFVEFIISGCIYDIFPFVSQVRVIDFSISLSGTPSLYCLNLKFAFAVAPLFSELQ